MILKALKIVIIAYLVLLLVMYLFQRHLLYHPQKYDIDVATSEYSDFSEKILKAEDGANIYLWEKISDKKNPTVIYFHGNGDMLPNLAPFFRQLAENGYNVVGMEYRGYGKSKYKITEKGLLHDAEVTLKYVKAFLPESPVILYGRSLGTGIAVRTAAEHTVAGIVLQSPYTSIEDIAADIYSYIPIRSFGLVLDKFDSYSLIDKINAPKIFVAGTRDKIIPLANTQKLYDKANEPKLLITVQDASHNNGYDDQEIIAEIKRFIENKDADNQQD